METLRIIQHMCFCGKHFLTFKLLFDLLLNDWNVIFEFQTVTFQSTLFSTTFFQFSSQFIDPCVAEALVPFYRQLLPIFNLFRDCNPMLFDRIDYNRAEWVGDVIDETLSVLEANGGPDAFINIKYCIPTYESCVNN